MYEKNKVQGSHSFLDTGTSKPEASQFYHALDATFARHGHALSKLENNNNTVPSESRCNLFLPVFIIRTQYKLYTNINNRHASCNIISYVP